jgi:hypothetical protein
VRYDNFRISGLLEACMIQYCLWTHSCALASVPLFEHPCAFIRLNMDFATAAHKSASVADTSSSRPQLTAFAAWLLRRFGARHRAKPALYGMAADESASAAEPPVAALANAPDAASGLPEPAASAKAAFAEPAGSPACERVRALPEPPLLTIVLRTAKRNGNVCPTLNSLLGSLEIYCVSADA